MTYYPSKTLFLSPFSLLFSYYSIIFHYILLYNCIILCYIQSYGIMSYYLVSYKNRELVLYERSMEKYYGR